MPRPESAGLRARAAPAWVQKFVRHRIAAFLAVGFLNTLVSYVIFACLVFAGLHYSLAVLVATVLSVLFNFFSYGNWVFHKNDPRLLWKFIVGYAFLYALNVVLLKGLQELRVNVYVAQIISVLPVVFITYLVNEYWVFRS